MTPAAGRPPFRAEMIGSLLRPRSLTQAYRLNESGAMGDAEHRAIQDQAIRDAVAMQEQLGFAVVTDGEFRRGSYWSRFVEAVDGLAIGPASYALLDRSGESAELVAPHVTGRLRRRHGIATDEFRFLAGLTNRTPKITLPSPSLIQFWRVRSPTGRALYPRDESFLDDLCAIYRAEIADLAALGCRYVQLDDLPLAMLCDPAIRARIAEEGEDPNRLVETYIAAINAAVAERPPGMIAALHLCRGNFKGKWLAEGGYEPVAERVFGDAAVDTVLLEFDSPRAGGFAPLRYLAKGKSAVLGLVCSKTPEMESVDALCRRIKEATRYVVLDRLAISPQCGFASTVSGNPLSHEHERRKLSLVVETARRVWGTA
ncbi:MAG: 5-methyltetrahydropteroyltriglutamate--homocysteine S-methyltransferase [Alphaproteobacteria bacterium]|nr:5-methyltetrahydropteroyltriglutamate--homocysteine S-methyltransferase [Alphaproteobacteria bacterium]